MIDTSLIEEAEKFLDIQSYGTLLPETRKLWTAWLIAFAEQHASSIAAADKAEIERLREGLEEAKETIESMPCFCKIGRICSSCQSIAKIKAILNSDSEREGK